MWTDPPSGWKYGFPKIWDQDKNPNFTEWLVSEGYPKKEIDSFGNNFWCRHWDVEPRETDEE